MTADAPKVGDRVKPVPVSGEPGGFYSEGTVSWVRKDRLVVLVTWDDGSGCDHWFTSQLETIS